ncbi:hypothetical protein [Pseudomonas sp. SWRI77]|uniref:hypothetical protein n=1 Tax=Pseudomonas sp. SWRI77 TaxID=2745485 RepID=UPI0016456074|nr:hypothetical protein [Pseudomonas sp. SWRI77]MBC3483576.1 hypothetical protein [Pseudomonas sp. SWRI77]
MTTQAQQAYTPMVDTNRVELDTRGMPSRAITDDGQVTQLRDYSSEMPTGITRLTVNTFNNLAFHRYDAFTYIKAAQRLKPIITLQQLSNYLLLFAQPWGRPVS